MGAFEGDVYKCVIGMDLLKPFKLVMDVENRLAVMTDKAGRRFTIRLIT